MQSKIITQSVKKKSTEDKLFNDTLSYDFERIGTDVCQSKLQWSSQRKKRIFIVFVFLWYFSLFLLDTIYLILSFVSFVILIGIAYTKYYEKSKLSISCFNKTYWSCLQYCLNTVFILEKKNFFHIKKRRISGCQKIPLKPL